MSGLYARNRQRTNKQPRPDLSPKAVSRAVLTNTAQRPLVLYPLAIGILGGLAALLLSPSMLFIVPALAGTGIGLGSWMLDATLRREKHAGDYLRQMHELLAGEAAAALHQLVEDLKEVNSKQGLGQLSRLNDKFEAFQELLRRKLNPEEITFTRYLGMTEQVYLAALDNLTRIADILKGLSAIDPRHIQSRLQELAALANRSKSQQAEYEALGERQRLLQQQQEKIEGWFSQNESAMTQLDLTMAAIAEMDTSLGQANMDMESAMQELRRLAERAHSYNID